MLAEAPVPETGGRDAGAAPSCGPAPKWFRNPRVWWLCRARRDLDLPFDAVNVERRGHRDDQVGADGESARGRPAGKTGRAARGAIAPAGAGNGPGGPGAGQPAACR